MLDYLCSWHALRKPGVVGEMIVRADYVCLWLQGMAYGLAGTLDGWLGISLGSEWQGGNSLGSRGLRAGDGESIILWLIFVSIVFCWLFSVSKELC